jgi:hypothetical protein
MAALTPHYQLQQLASGDVFALNGQKYTFIDRAAIDRLLYIGAQGHHHDGAGIGQADPTNPSSLTVDTTSGTLSASLRATYTYTWVDVNGFETAPAPATFVDLPSAVAPPGSPTITAAGGGTLLPGPYFYALAGYTGVNTAETTAPNQAYFSLSATGSLELGLATPTSGTTGVNVYRRKPGSVAFYYVTSLVTSGTTPVTSWTDDGSIPDTFSRQMPVTNSTASTNSVTITIPVPVPIGFTWNLYRTFTTGNWTNSLLHHVVENDGGATPTILTTFTDNGGPSAVGAPPTTSQLISSPTKILLTGGAEVEGSLPSSVVSYYPVVVTFAFPGTLALTTGQTVWVNDFYPNAYVLSVRASLGRGSTPASDPVIIDVERGTGGATPTYSSIFAAMATPTYPTVSVGLQIGTLVQPGTVLDFEDSLSVDITQTGGGATPTDHDLMVTIVLLISGSGLPDYS